MRYLDEGGEMEERGLAGRISVPLRTKTGQVC